MHHLNLYDAQPNKQIQGEQMASYSENYLILSEVLRKMDMDENYQPTDYEQKIVALLLEQEEKPSPRRSKIKKYSNLDW